MSGGSVDDIIEACNKFTVANGTNSGKETPIHAIFNNERLTVDDADYILRKISAKTPCDLPDKRGKKSLHLAAITKLYNCFNYLIEKCNAETNSIDANGMTPLHYLLLNVDGDTFIDNVEINQLIKINTLLHLRGNGI